MVVLCNEEEDENEEDD
jgi:hypothetical protein